MFAFASNCIISVEPRNKHGKFGKERSKELNALKINSEIIGAVIALVFPSVGMGNDPVAGKN